MLRKVRKSPGDPFLRRSYAETLLAWGFHNQAAREYRKVYGTLASGASTVPLAEADRTALVLACEKGIAGISRMREKEGDSLFAEKKFEPAESAYVDALLVGSPDHDLVVDKLAEATIAQADELAESSRTVRSAESKYRSATRILPEGHPRRVYAEERLEKLRKLLEPAKPESPTKDLEEIIGIVPGDPDLRKGLAMRYCMEDRLEDALRELDKAKEIDPNADVSVEYSYVAERYGCRGIEALEGGDYEKARSYLEKSLEMRRNDAIALHLGDAYARLGESARAKEIFEKFISQDEGKLSAADPEDYSTRRDLHDSLASMYEKMGREARAREHGKAAAECREKVRERILAALKKQPPAAQK